MPALKQLDCQIKWAGSGLSLKVYHISYGDGFVHGYIAVPPIATPFYVQLKSDGFIAPGLAMFVYIDGEYQCNRNRCNLRTPDKASLKHQTEIDFIVRQKEKLVPGGHFVTRRWRFEQGNVPVHDSQNPSIVSCGVDYAGSIEVVVLRCYQAEESRSRKSTVLSSPSTVSDIELSSEDEHIPDSTVGKAHTRGYDGSIEGPPNTYLPFESGADGSWDDQPQWHATSGQDQHTIHPRTLSRTAVAGSPNILPHQENGDANLGIQPLQEWSTRTIGSNANQYAPHQTSPAIIINVNQTPVQPEGAMTPRLKVGGAGHSGPRTPQASGDAMIPRSWNQGEQNTWKDVENQPAKETWSGHHNSNDNGGWDKQAGNGGEYASDQDHHSAAAIYDNHNDNVGSDYHKEPNDQSWLHESTHGEQDNDRWEHHGDQTEDNNVEAWDNNDQNQVNGKGWSGEQNQDNDTNRNNDIQNHNSSQKWDSANGDSQANPQTNNAPWSQTQRPDHSGSLPAESTHLNQTGLESLTQSSAPEPGPFQPNPTAFPGQLPLPFVTNPDESYFKPYWASWNQPPAESDVVFVGEDDISLDSDSSVPSGLQDTQSGAEERGGTKRSVHTGSPATYLHKVGRPRYMDTYEKPYAVFAFSYRSTAVIESMLGVHAQETAEEERTRLSVLTKDEILDFYMRAKEAPGPQLSSQGIIMAKGANVPITSSKDPPGAGLGIDLKSMDNKLADLAFPTAGLLGTSDQNWNDHSKPQANPNTETGKHQWNGNGSGEQSPAQQQAAQRAETGHPIWNNVSSTAGAQEPSSGGSKAQGWGGTETPQGQKNAPTMTEALPSPHAGQLQPIVGNKEVSW